MQEFKPGDKVHYVPRLQNGIVKSVGNFGLLFIVYKCNEDWDNYQNYTGSATSPIDVNPGWHEENNNPVDDNI